MYFLSPFYKAIIVAAEIFFYTHIKCFDFVCYSVKIEMIQIFSIICSVFIYQRKSGA